MKIKVNDNVKMLSGKERGKTGKVTQVFPKDAKVVVEGLNIIKKHLHAQKRGEKGQIIELSAPVPVARLMLNCPRCGKPTRVGYRLDGDAKKRSCRQCGEFID